MRVGFLIDRWQPDRGGAERALADLAAWLAERGHEPRAFAVLGTAPFDAVRAPLALTRGRRERALGAALVEAAEAARCDVTVGVRHLPRVDLYWPHGGSHAAALRGRATGRHRTFVAMERELLDGGGARKIACVSGLVLRELAAAYPKAAERLVLVPNGIDLDRFHPRHRRDERATPVLGFSARRPELKGLPALLEALAGLLSRPWTLLVAGSRDPRVRGLPSERVRVLPEVDPAAFAASIDLLVHPTWRDACGLVVLEALAAGTPVVTTWQAGAAEAVATSEQGIVLDDPGDVDALRSAIGAALDRIASGPVDRESVRSAVAGRDRAAWLGSLESILLDLAARRPV